MQEIDDPLTGAEDSGEDEPRRRIFSPRRAIAVILILLVLVGLAVLPPLANVNRYRLRIAASIGASLGRPVRVDSVTLTMLPWPGFEIQNFVVAEDPVFGSEPVIHANTVRATLRVNSLWRRRVEFSRISLIEPSVNLVHLPDGRWNLESILLQASRMPAAPTAQKGASEEPRFPYIEATGARLNLKRGVEKVPFSLTEADFALWLAQPNRWQVRLVAHPTRTDTSVSDTGTLRVEGTLGRAASVADVPLDLKAEWSTAPLGAVSWMLLDEDEGLRGLMDLTASVHGTMGNNALTATLKLERARRAEFVPADPLEIDLGCQAQAKSLFHTLDSIQCAWPSDSMRPGLTLTGSVPDVRQPGSARSMVWINGVPASGLVDGLRVLSRRTPVDLTLGGTLSGKLRYPLVADDVATKTPAETAVNELTNELTIQGARLNVGEGAAFVDGVVKAQVESDSLQLTAVPLALGDKEPATLEGSFRKTGYTLHLSGMVLRSRLLAFGAAIPQLGDGLADVLPVADEDKAKTETPVLVDLTAERTWGGTQVWTQTPAAKPVVKRKGSRR